MKNKKKAAKNVKLDYHYSGECSRDFWLMVNTREQPHKDRLYALGVALQNLEEQVLKDLRIIAPNNVRER